jgi:hypothetical protein
MFFPRANNPGAKQLNQIDCQVDSRSSRQNGGVRATKAASCRGRRPAHAARSVVAPYVRRSSRCHATGTHYGLCDCDFTCLPSAPQSARAACSRVKACRNPRAASTAGHKVTPGRIRSDRPPEVAVAVRSRAVCGRAAGDDEVLAGFVRWETSRDPNLLPPEGAKHREVGASYRWPTVPARHG